MTGTLPRAWDELDPDFAATPEGRIKAALEVATWGSCDGEHHKQWVIDQMVRVLTGCPEVELVNPSAVGGPYHYLGLGKSEEYVAWAYMASGGDEREPDGSPMYEPWDEGIAP